MQLSDEQRLDWLRLIRSERIGPRTFRALVNQYGGARAALEAMPEIARRSGRLSLRVTSRAEAERERDEITRLGGRLIAQGEPDYPRTLQAIETAPPLVTLLGEAGALHRPTVAIVGSRNASAAGLTFAERLALELGGAGYVVVSGLARGIDARAHRGAVRTGTVAVLPGGLARIYPGEHARLLAEIVAAGGAAVSEMPVGWEARGRDFPRRNRIVSGLSYGVVVVEAARRSGSLITARFALEQGREVFAVPGSPLDPRAEGTNDLIRGGATLCASIDHILPVLAPLLSRQDMDDMPGDVRDGGEGRYGTIAPLWDELDGLDLPIGSAPTAEIDEADASPSDPRQRDDPGDEAAGTEADALLALLSTAPVSVDDLARQADLPVRRVQQALVELELGGHVSRQEGGGVTLRS